MGRFQEGEHIDVHIAQAVGGDLPVVYRLNVDSGAFHEPAAEGKPLGTVVIAAGDKHRKVSLSQLAEEFIQQFHGFCRGCGSVVDVPRQK